jgi:hypothetical protein
VDGTLEKSITYTTPKGMKCRDGPPAESKYLKERMELSYESDRKLSLEELKQRNK